MGSISGALLGDFLKVMRFQLEDTMPEVVLREALMTAAFPGEPLGRSYWCPIEALPRLEASMVRDFRNRCVCVCIH